MRFLRMTACIVAIIALASCGGAHFVMESADPVSGQSHSFADREELLASAAYFEEKPEDILKFSMLNMTLYGDTLTSRAFTWYTAPSVVGSDIRYAPVYEDVPDLLRIRVVSGNGGVAADQDSLYWHKAELDDLQPGTEYIYQIGDSKAGVWGPVSTFKMADSQAGFAFLFVSDTHVKNENSAATVRETVELALKTEPDIQFVVHGGDIVSDAAKPEQWLLAMDSLRPVITSVPIVPATGNHDNGKGIFSRHFNLPSPWSSDAESGAYYSFSYGAAHFVVLNTNERSNTYGYLSERQVEWLRGDIESARESGAVRIIVIMHRGPYSLGENAGDERVAVLRASVPALFDELRVDLVLQGHDHIASRSKPILGGEASDAGTIYLNAGPAGRGSDDPSPDMPESYFSLFDFWTQHPSELEYQSFCVIRADDSGTVSGILYETFGEPGAPAHVADRFTLPAMPSPTDG